MGRPPSPPLHLLLAILSILLSPPLLLAGTAAGTRRTREPGPRGAGPSGARSLPHPEALRWAPAPLGLLGAPRDGLWRDSWTVPIHPQPVMWGSLPLWHPVHPDSVGRSLHPWELCRAVKGAWGWSLPSLREIERLQFFLQPCRRSWGALGWGQCPPPSGCAVTPNWGAAQGACWQVLRVVAQADLELGSFYPAVPAGPTCAASRQATCGAACIPVPWLCDGEQQCPDGTDEQCGEPGEAGTHPLLWGGSGGCAVQALRGLAALGGGETGQARGTCLLAGSANGFCMATCRNMCVPELLGDVWGMGTYPGSYAERGSPHVPESLAGGQPLGRAPWALPAPVPCQGNGDPCGCAKVAGPSDCVLSLQMLHVAGIPMFGSVMMAGACPAAGVAMVLLTAQMALMSRTVVCSLCWGGLSGEPGAQGRA